MRNKMLYPEEEELIDSLRAAAEKLGRSKEDKRAAQQAIAKIEEKHCMAAIPLKIETKSEGMKTILKKFDTISPFPSAPNGGKSILYITIKAVVLQANGEAK